MPYVDTMFLGHIPYSPNNGAATPFGYCQVDEMRASDWLKALKDAAEYSPWGGWGVLHEHSSGLAASNGLTRIILNLSKFLCNLANSEFVSLSDTEAAIRDPQRKAEAGLQQILKQQSQKRGQLAHGDFVGGLRTLSSCCQWTELRNLLQAKLPEECARFVEASEELKKRTADVRSHAWLSFIEDNRLRTSTRRNCTIDEFLKAIIELRNDEAHDRAGGVSGAPGGAVSKIDPGDQEEWHSVVAHYLAPALRALLLHDSVATCLKRLQIVDVVTKHQKGARVKWNSSAAGRGYPREMQGAEAVEGLAVAVYDGRTLNYLARFMEFPQPRQEIAEQKKKLSQLGVDFILKHGTAPAVEDIQKWSEQLKLESAINSGEVLVDSVKLFDSLRSWSDGDGTILPDHLSFAGPLCWQSGDSESNSAVAGAVRAAVDDAKRLMDAQVARRVKGAMSTLNDIAGLLGDPMLARASLLRLVQGSAELGIYAIDPEQLDRTVFRPRLRQEALEMAKVVQANKRSALATIDSISLAKMLSTIEVLFDLVGLRRELQELSEGVDGTEAELFEGIQEWRETLLSGNPTSPASGDSANSQSPSKSESSHALILEVDLETLTARGLTGLFRGLNLLFERTVNTDLKDRLRGLTSLVGPNAVKIGYNRVLFNTEPKHSNGAVFGYPVTVRLEGSDLYFEAGGVGKAQGVLALAKALRKLGCSVVGTVDDIQVFPEEFGEQLRDADTPVVSETPGLNAEVPRQDSNLRLTLLLDGLQQEISGTSVRKFFENLLSVVLKDSVSLQKLDAMGQIFAGKRAGTRRYLIAREPVHADGKHFFSVLKMPTVAGDFYVELNWSCAGALACAVRLCEALEVPIDIEDDEEDAGDSADGHGTAVSEPASRASTQEVELYYEFDGHREVANSVSDLFRKLFNFLDKKGLLAGLGSELKLADILPVGKGRVSNRSLWSANSTHPSGTEYKDAREYRGSTSGIEFSFEANFTRAAAQIIVNALVEKVSAIQVVSSLPIGSTPPGPANFVE